MLDVKATDNAGMNVAHLAAGHVRLSVLKWLLEVELLDVKKQDAKGKNVVSYQ